MSLSVLSDVEDDRFRRKRPLRKINFNPKKKNITTKFKLVHTKKSKKKKLPLPLSIINSIVADKGLCKYPRGISTVSRYCHRYLHQYTNSQIKLTKSFSNNDQRYTNLDVNISSMKRLIELFCNAFPRLPQIHRERYLPTTTTSFLILENNQTFSNGTTTSVVPGGILPEDLTWIVFFLMTMFKSQLKQECVTDEQCLHYLDRFDDAIERLYNSS